MQLRLENIKIVAPKARIMILKKHACHKVVAIATSSLLDTRHLCQNVPSYILAQVTKFTGNSRNGHEITQLQI